MAELRFHSQSLGSRVPGLATVLCSLRGLRIRGLDPGSISARLHHPLLTRASASSWAPEPTPRATTSPRSLLQVFAQMPPLREAHLTGQLPGAPDPAVLCPLASQSHLLCGHMCDTRKVCSEDRRCLKWPSGERGQLGQGAPAGAVTMRFLGNGSSRGSLPHFGGPLGGRRTQVTRWRCQGWAGAFIEGKAGQKRGQVRGGWTSRGCGAGSGLSPCPPAEGPSAWDSRVQSLSPSPLSWQSLSLPGILGPQMPSPGRTPTTSSVTGDLGGRECQGFVTLGDSDSQRRE